MCHGMLKVADGFCGGDMINKTFGQSHGHVTRTNINELMMLRSTRGRKSEFQMSRDEVKSAIG